MYLCVKGVDISSFYDFDIWFWNCSDSVVFFAFSFYYPSFEIHLDILHVDTSYRLTYNGAHSRIFPKDVASVLKVVSGTLKRLKYMTY